MVLIAGRAKPDRRSPSSNGGTSAAPDLPPQRLRDMAAAGERFDGRTVAAKAA